jgi:transcriptional regulator with XRE-family HTH domain
MTDAKNPPIFETSPEDRIDAAEAQIASDTRAFLGRAIRDRLDELNWTQGEFSEASGRKAAQTSEWIRGRTNMSVAQMLGSEAALHLPSGALLVRAGLVQLSGLIDQDIQLDDIGKRQVLDSYRRQVAESAQRRAGVAKLTIEVPIPDKVVRDISRLDEEAAAQLEKMMAGSGVDYQFERGRSLAVASVHASIVNDTVARLQAESDARTAEVEAQQRAKDERAEMEAWMTEIARKVAAEVIRDAGPSRSSD